MGEGRGIYRGTNRRRLCGWRSGVAHVLAALERDPGRGREALVFCTVPAIRCPWANFFVRDHRHYGARVWGAGDPFKHNFTQPGWATGLGPLLIGLLIFSIGLSLGGPTGYAINPARDLGPRIAHAILPIAGKGGSDWGYAWVPIAGPIIGGVFGALSYKALLG
jgi:glycerol uptake facilitator protein